MPGPPRGPFGADNDDVAGLDRAIEDGGEGGFLALENARGAGEAEAFLAGDFGDGALGRQVAAQDDEVADPS